MHVFNTESERKIYLMSNGWSMHIIGDNVQWVHMFCPTPCSPTKAVLITQKWVELGSYEMS
jgi:hypothetical protein